MPETFTVTKARYAGEKDNPHGGKLHKFYCSFVDANGNGQSDVYWQRKSEQSPEGEQFYGHIEEGEFGPRFKTDQNPNGGPPRSGGSSQGKDDYWRKKEERDIESQARMGRAHAQEMAIRVLAGQEGGLLAQDTQLRQRLLDWTDWFHADVQRFPTSGGPQPETGAADPATGREGPDPERQPGNGSPPEVSSQPTGFVSEKQRAYYDRLLNNTEWSSGERATVTRYLQQTNKATVSAAIDALKDGSDAEKAGLLNEAANWAAQQSDVPRDEEGLDPNA